MKKILALALFAVALVSCRQTMQTDGILNYPVIWKASGGDTLFLKTFYYTRLERRRDRYHIGGKGGFSRLLFLWNILLFIY